MANACSYKVVHTLLIVHTNADVGILGQQNN